MYVQAMGDQTDQKCQLTLPLIESCELAELYSNTLDREVAIVMRREERFTLTSWLSTSEVATMAAATTTGT